MTELSSLTRLVWAARKLSVASCSRYSPVAVNPPERL